MEGGAGSHPSIMTLVSREPSGDAAGSLRDVKIPFPLSSINPEYLMEQVSNADLLLAPHPEEQSYF